MAVCGAGYGGLLRSGSTSREVSPPVRGNRLARMYLSRYWLFSFVSTSICRLLTLQLRRLHVATFDESEKSWSCTFSLVNGSVCPDVLIIVWKSVNGSSPFDSYTVKQCGVASLFFNLSWCSSCGPIDDLTQCCSAQSFHSENIFIVLDALEPICSICQRSLDHTYSLVNGSNVSWCSNRSR